MKSIFQPDVSSSAFLHFERNGMQNLQKHLSELEPSLKGRVLRGPAKLPERANAKVSQVFAFFVSVLLEFAKVHRTDCGDVSLITNIVRFAVQFDDAAFFRQRLDIENRATASVLHQHEIKIERQTSFRNE